MLKLSKYFVVILTLTMVFGCSVFGLLVERTINGYEEKIANRIGRYAEFNESQLVIIDQLAADIDDWMRVERLSKVNIALRRVADNIEFQGQVSESYSREVYQETQRGLLLSQAPHLVNGFSELAFTLSDAQATQVIEKMDERIERWSEDLEDRTLESQNKHVLNNIVWFFRAIDRSLSKEEKAQVMLILNERKVDFALNLQQSKNRIQELQTLIKGRNVNPSKFREGLQLLWVQAELPDAETEPEKADYNFSVIYRCLSYLTSILSQKDRDEVGIVLRDHAKLFAELSES